MLQSASISSALQEADQSRPVRSLLQFYFDTIRPFALSAGRAWLWVDDPSVVLSSPVLTYAICAYSSAFKTSVEGGLHKLVLPPDPNDGDEPLWPVPEWFVFHAQAISLLHRHLASSSSSTRPIQKAELHATLFLMRIAVLLGDRQSALLHLNAIRTATENATIVPDMHIDIALWNIDLSITYRNRGKVRQRPYVRAADPSRQSPLFQWERSNIQDVTEWKRLQASTLDRRVVWRTESPTDIDTAADPAELVEDLLQNDPATQQLNDEIQRSLKICLQVSRYLLAYLRYLHADTSSAHIRALVADLQQHVSILLQQDEIPGIWRRAPRIMFYVTFAGAFASRGFRNERQWFARKINAGIVLQTSTSYEDMKNILGMFVDLDSVHEVLLQEVWEDVLACK